jgi:hypothetical protein
VWRFSDSVSDLLIRGILIWYQIRGLAFDSGNGTLLWYVPGGSNDSKNKCLAHLLQTLEIKLLATIQIIYYLYKIIN